ncbi:GNAT family N-acetyltransferase [Paraburkholderia hayleyella]|uniref:GNAT family N-acetyltransferase n=1 Tax=Paraburkholderia hayleyella TaxID=2152889 RepID=UPI001291FC88|nr:GNAT family N-acetyltransferase [Paraburkholderia hayleyella]
MRSNATIRLVGAPQLVAIREGTTLLVAEEGCADRIIFQASCSEAEGIKPDEVCHGLSADEQFRAVLAALSGFFMSAPGVAVVMLDSSRLHPEVHHALLHSGVLTAAGQCIREAWAQQPSLWLTRPRTLPLCAHSDVTAASHASATAGGALRHPRRPPRLPGVVYERDIPAFGHRFTLRTATLTDDAERLHAWMNEPRVNAFWGEAGSFEAVQAWLHGVLASPHTHPLIGAFDGEPFGYFEAYWAKEDRIAPFAAPGDYDRGLHMLVGATRWRGPACVAAWLPSLVHYLFLDDPRTAAVFCEPRHDNLRMIGYLEQHGFTGLHHFDFPHKRALLVRSTRREFFDGRHV